MTVTVFSWGYAGWGYANRRADSGRGCHRGEPGLSPAPASSTSAPVANVRAPRVPRRCLREPAGGGETPLDAGPWVVGFGPRREGPALQVERPSAVGDLLREALERARRRQAGDLLLRLPLAARRGQASLSSGPGVGAAAPGCPPTGPAGPGGGVAWGASPGTSSRRFSETVFQALGRGAVVAAVARDFRPSRDGRPAARFGRHRPVGPTRQAPGLWAGPGERRRVVAALVRLVLGSGRRGGPGARPEAPPAPRLPGQAKPQEGIAPDCRSGAASAGFRGGCFFDQGRQSVQVIDVVPPLVAPAQPRTYRPSLRTSLRRG